MGHYAKINKDNVVEQVIVAKADYINTLSDKDSYIKTSYNTIEGIHYQSTLKDGPDINKPSEDQSKALRYRFAAIGMIYNKTHDIFHPPQKYPSWTFVVKDETDFAYYWKPPHDPPQTKGSDGKLQDYKWDEDAYQADNTKGWVLDE